MSRCEDYPCCEHAGDGGPCPDESGRFRCVECGGMMPRNASSSLCNKCIRAELEISDLERQGIFDGRYDNGY